MNPWLTRPREERYLFNPAFMGALACQAADGYRREGGQSLPMPLAFLILPVVLHKPTRSILPRAVSTSLAAWLQEHPDVLIGYPERARALAPFVREGLLFAARHGALHAQVGHLALGNVQQLPSSAMSTTTEDFRDCTKRSLFVGRWIALAGDVGTVMTLWGVRP